jgi:hypothetical protein
MTNTDIEYRQWLSDLKARIRQSQIKASVRVNTSMIELYWTVGADIVEKQAEKKWGSGIIRQLSKDLRSDLTDVEGFSETNLRYMKRFYVFYSQQDTKQHQLGAKLPVSTKKSEIFNEQLSKPFQHQFGAEFGTLDILGAVPWRHHIEILNKAKLCFMCRKPLKTVGAGLF